MHCPAPCHDGDEMSCYGGKDMNGCQHPDFCAPTKRKIVYYDTARPATARFLGPEKHRVVQNRAI